MELFFLLLLFFVVSLVQGAAQRKKQGGRSAPRGRARPARLPAERAPGEAPRSIRELFEEVRRSMEEAERRARGEVEAPVPAVDKDEVEKDEEDLELFVDRGSLEEEPEVQSLETEVRRPERVVVAADEQAERITRERLRWAEQRSRRRTAADHREFDQRIRQPEPAPAPAASDRTAELRRAIIWREVLDRPLALREDR